MPDDYTPEILHEGSVEGLSPEVAEKYAPMIEKILGMITPLKPPRPGPMFPVFRPIVIGLGGYQEHGKDALADILVERHGFEKFGMSDAINEALIVLDPLIGSTRYADLVEAIGYTAAKRHPEVRRLLRIFGTEVGRDMIDPDIWVNVAGKKIRAALDNGAAGVVVTGIRNGANEIGLVKIFGGTTVWVDRPGHPIPDTDHRSETSVTSADFERIVKNDGDLIDLVMAADLLIDGIRERRAEAGR